MTRTDFFKYKEIDLDGNLDTIRTFFEKNDSKFALVRDVSSDVFVLGTISPDTNTTYSFLPREKEVYQGQCAKIHWKYENLAGLLILTNDDGSI